LENKNEMNKFQKPIIRSQINSNIQDAKNQSGIFKFLELKIDVWSLFVIWFLIIGA